MEFAHGGGDVTDRNHLRLDVVGVHVEVTRDHEGANSVGCQERLVRETLRVAVGINGLNYKINLR